MSVFIGLIDRERLTDTRGRLSIHQKVVSDTIFKDEPLKSSQSLKICNAKRHDLKKVTIYCLGLKA